MARTTSLLGFALVMLGLSQCSRVGSSPAQSQPPQVTRDVEYSLVRQSASHPSRGVAAAVGEAGKPVGRCDVEICEGNLSPTALSELRRAAERTRECYEHELKERNQLEGRMLVRLRLAAGREPCESRIEQNTMAASEGFTECVLERIRESSARPDTGCIDLALPLSFVREEIDAAKGSAAPQ